MFNPFKWKRIRCKKCRKVFYVPRKPPLKVETTYRGKTRPAKHYFNCTHCGRSTNPFL